jgi:hypothetical protein
MISGYSRKVFAGMIAATVAAAALGVYLSASFPSQATKTIGGGLEVLSNRVVAVEIPGYQYSIGIWQLELSNSGSTPLYATYQIFVSGGLGYGNSSEIQPGKQATTTSCLIGPISPTTTFDVPIFVTNTTGTVAPHYPVTVVNTTQTSFSGQFSASFGLQSTVFSKQFQRNVSNWSVIVTNTGNKPIQFIMATLWNGSSLIASSQLRCAGSGPWTPALPTDYAQALPPGQTADSTRTIIPSIAGISSGKTFRAEITVLYADHSQVTQTYQIQST